MNTFKSTLLLVTLTVFLILIGARVGGRNGMVLAFAISVVLNFVTYFFSDKLALKMYNAQAVTREQLPRAYAAVERLTAKQGLPMPKIYVLPTESPRTRLLRDGIRNMLRWRLHMGFCNCWMMKSWRACWRMSWGM
jgi:heat shock protein HtpX